MVTYHLKHFNELRNLNLHFAHFKLGFSNLTLCLKFKTQRLTRKHLHFNGMGIIPPPPLLKKEKPSSQCSSLFCIFCCLEQGVGDSNLGSPCGKSRAVLLRHKVFIFFVLHLFFLFSIIGGKLHFKFYCCLTKKFQWQKRLLLLMLNWRLKSMW